MQELEYYVDGYMMREARTHDAHRKIWQVLFNSNVKKGDRISNEKLVEVWPLYIDPEHNPKLAARLEKARSTEAELLREKFHQLRKQIRENDEHRRNSGNTGSTDSPSV